MNRTDESPSAVLLRLLNGFRVSQAIYVAATLGLADLLKDGARGRDDLAAATGTHPQALYRLLRALACVGVFREEPNLRFALTPLGECLCLEAPQPVGPTAVQDLGPEMWQAWAHLLHSVRTGENAFRHAHDMDVWDYRAGQPEVGAVFDRAMVAHSRRVAQAVLAAYDLSRFGTIVDVGGGQGAFLAAVLARHPRARGVLFDQAHVVAGAEPELHAAGVAGRCQVVPGSFFEAVPEGGDAYVLKMVIHDWEDDEATAILRACRRAMAPGATLLVIERVLDPPNEGAAGKFSDLQMLVGAGGQERTREEFAILFSLAGFRFDGVIAADSMSVIVGAPA